MKSLLSEIAVIDAAHSVWASHYASEADIRGFQFQGGPGNCLENQVPTLPAATHLPIMWRYIGHIEQAWGVHDIGLVFHHAGWTDDEKQASILFRLLMSCIGHGIGITDETEDARALERAGEILSRYKDRTFFDPSPCDFGEISEYQDLADEMADNLIGPVPAEA